MLRDELADRAATDRHITVYSRPTAGFDLMRRRARNGSAMPHAIEIHGEATTSRNVSPAG
jgi:hypothetical protein